MLIPIPGSVGRLTGWKAVVGVIVIVGISIGGYLLSRQPRSIGSGTWDVPAGKAMFYQLKASQTANLKLEFIPQSPAAYTIYVVDEMNKVRLDAPLTDPDTVQKIWTTQATGPVTVPQLTLGAGTYFIITENTAKSPLSIKYEFSEIHP